MVEGSLSSLFAVFYLKDGGIASHRSGSLKKKMHALGVSSRSVQIPGSLTPLATAYNRIMDALKREFQCLAKS